MAQRKSESKDLRDEMLVRAYQIFDSASCASRFLRERRLASSSIPSWKTEWRESCLLQWPKTSRR